MAPMIKTTNPEWEVHVEMGEDWHWHATSTNGDKLEGSTETRWGAKKAAKRAIRRFPPKPMPDYYDFTFKYRL